MDILKLKEKEQASEMTKGIYNSLEEKIGKVPNVYKVLGNSGAALKATLDIGRTIDEKGSLNKKEMETIALAMAQANDCEYCKAAHTVSGKKAGLSEEETIELRSGECSDEKLNAVSMLTKSICDNRGYPDSECLEQFYNVGYSDVEMSEVIVLVGLNTITNYSNHIAKTPIDYPEAKTLEEA